MSDNSPQFRRGDHVFVGAEVVDVHGNENDPLLGLKITDNISTIYIQSHGLAQVPASPSSETDAYHLLDTAIANKCCTCTENGDVCQPHEALALVAEHLDAKTSGAVSSDDEEFCEKCYAGTESDEHHEKCESVAK